MSRLLVVVEHYPELRATEAKKRRLGYSND
ncbi:MAG: LemA family protein [bacterium]|nr:LemA family protein [bacterium]